MILYPGVIFFHLICVLMGFSSIEHDDVTISHVIIKFSINILMVHSIALYECRIAFLFVFVLIVN